MTGVFLETYPLLEKYKIPFQPELLAKSAQHAAKLAKQAGFPVALKVSSSTITHKTDVGGVQLNLRSEQEVINAYNLMEKSIGNKMDGAKVQKMAPHGFELIVGGVRDSQFGHLVLFGLGGIYVEVFKDLVFRVCPIDKPLALEMIHSIKAYKMLSGSRGRPPVDENAIADVIVKTSKMMVEEGLDELDFNPLIANEKGCVVVDCRISKKAETKESETE